MIDYRIADLTDSRVVLEQPRRSVAASVWFWVIVALAAAFIFFVFDWSKPFDAGPALPVLAFFALFLSSFAAIRGNWTPGHTLTFDGESGAIEVRDTESGDVVRWPLAECREVTTRQNRHSQSGPSGTTYYATVHLHDGAQIPVFSGYSERDRDSVADRLRTLIERASASPRAPMPVPALPSMFHETRTGTTTTLHWSTRMRVSAFVSLLVAWLAGMTLVVSLARASLGLGSGSWFVIGFLGLFALIPSLLLWIGIITQLRAHRRSHTLEISSRGLEYRAGNGWWPARDHWTLEADRAASVRFGWARGALEFPETETDRAPQVALGHVSIGDTIAVEQWLQHELSARWGRAVG